MKRSSAPPLPVSDNHSAMVMMPRVDDSSFLLTIPEDDGEDSGLANNRKFELPLSVRSEAASSTGAAVVDTHHGGDATQSSSAPGTDISREAVLPDVADSTPNNNQEQATTSAAVRARGALTYHGVDWKSRTTLSILILVLGTVILIIVAIVLVVVLTRLPASSSSDAAQNRSPTPAPTVSPATVAQLDAILYNISNPTTFQDTTSPQSLARHWMLTEDLLLLDVLNDGFDATSQRYIFTELAFALAPQPHDVISNDSEVCAWPGLVCDDGSSGHIVTRVHWNNRSLTGSLPAEVGKLNNLQELSLSENQIVGDVPDEWLVATALPHLYWLDLAHNQLSGTLSPQLWQLPVLRFVYLQDNLFEGPIAAPTTLPGDPILQDVWLDSNDFSGTFPAFMLQHFRHLRSLVLANNHLMGPMPDGFLYPTNLTYLDCSINQFIGSIPVAMLRSTTSIEKLYIDINHLSGVLPDTASLLDPNQTYALQYFFLHNNSLQGTIPDQFGSPWKQLISMTLHDNDLSGTVSSTLCAHWPQLSGDGLTADCATNASSSSMPPRVDCACCTQCF